MQGEPEELRSVNLEAVANAVSPRNVTGHMAPRRHHQGKPRLPLFFLPSRLRHTGHGSASGPQKSLVLTSCLVHSLEGFKLNPK